MTLEQKQAIKEAVEESPKFQGRQTVVGMVKKPEAELPAAAAVAVAEEPKQSERNTITRWDVFVESKLYPTYIRCQSYGFPEFGDDSCHTNLPLKAENLISHVDNGHGGHFFMSFRDNYADSPYAESPVKQHRAWSEWKRFEEEGIELRDFRCDVCGAEPKLTVRSIAPHLRPHAGKSSRRRPGGDFNFTLSRQFAIDTDEEE